MANIVMFRNTPKTDMGCSVFVRATTNQQIIIQMERQTTTANSICTKNLLHEQMDHRVNVMTAFDTPTNHERIHQCCYVVLKLALALRSPHIYVRCCLSLKQLCIEKMSIQITAAAKTFECMWMGCIWESLKTMFSAARRTRFDRPSATSSSK